MNVKDRTPENPRPNCCLRLRRVFADHNAFGLTLKQFVGTLEQAINKPKRT
jgi:hypothetical protein